MLSCILQECNPPDMQMIEWAKSDSQMIVIVIIWGCCGDIEHHQWNEPAAADLTLLTSCAECEFKG